MMVPGESDGVVIGRADELEPGRTRKFVLRHGRVELECFAANYEGRIVAYVNRCCHIPMTMDWVENRFFTEDGRYLLCATHGACYLPETGKCVAGPPVGRYLTPVPIEIVAGEIVAYFPPGETTGG